MSTDITGWIQARFPEEEPGDPFGGWVALVRIDRLVERNYGMFGSLFGVRNDYGFRPLAPDRGAPGDSSPDLERWGAEPEPPFPSEPSWITWGELRAIDWDERGTKPRPGEALAPRRQEVLTPGWNTALGLMEVLAKQFGDDGVRMVVWFE